MANLTTQPRFPTMSKELPSRLNSDLITQIDRALQRVGDFGEVRLVVTKGRLRYIATTQSEPVADGEAPGSAKP